MDAATIESIVSRQIEHHVTHTLPKSLEPRFTRLHDAIHSQDRALVELWKKKDAQLADKDKQIREKDKQLADKDHQLEDKDKQLAEKDTTNTDLNEKVEELNKTKAQLQNKLNHSFEKGKLFEETAIERVRASLQGIHGATVEKVHAHGADMVITVPLPYLDCGRPFIKILVECKNHDSIQKEATYIKTLAADCAAQNAHGAILLYADIEPQLKDYAADNKKEHEKEGMAKEYMMMCDPTNLMAAIVALMARLQPLDVPADAKEAFEAPFRKAMKRKCDAMAKTLVACYNVNNLIPVSGTYKDTVAQGKAAVDECFKEFVNDDLFEEESNLMVQAGRMHCKEKSFARGKPDKYDFNKIRKEGGGSML